MPAIQIRKIEHFAEEKKLLNLCEVFKPAYIQLLLVAYDTHEKGYVALPNDCKVEGQSSISLGRAITNLSCAGVIHTFSPTYYKSGRNHPSFRKDNPGVAELELEIDPNAKKGGGRIFVINPDYWDQLKEIKNSQK